MICNKNLQGDDCAVFAVMLLWCEGNGMSQASNYLWMNLAIGSSHRTREGGIKTAGDAI